MLIHHTDCGLQRITDDAFREELRRTAGAEPRFPVGAFSDVDESVRASIRRVVASPFLPHRGAVRGFVYDVDTGALREVSA
jgi:carbonic anhydrase